MKHPKPITREQFAEKIAKLIVDNIDKASEGNFFVRVNEALRRHGYGINAERQGSTVAAYLSIMETK